MSRHLVTARDDAQYICEVGFDPRLNTYYAAILDRERSLRAAAASARLEQDLNAKKMFSSDDVRAAADNIEVLFVGGTPHEINTVEELAARIQTFADLTDESRNKLRADRQSESAPSPALRDHAPGSDKQGLEAASL